MDCNLMWECPECRETIAESFDMCWNCGTSREGEPDRDFASADSMTADELAALPKIDDGAFAQSPVDESGVKKPRFSLRTMLLLFLAAQAFLAFEMWYRNPRTPRDFFDCGATHMGKGEFDEAIVDLDRALELCDEPRDSAARVSILVTRALAHNRLGHYRQAVDDITKVTDLAEPGSDGFITMGLDIPPIPEGILSSWLLIRAEAQMRLHEYDIAITDLEQVLNYHPGNPTATRLLASAKQQQKVAP